MPDERPYERTLMALHEMKSAHNNNDCECGRGSKQPLHTCPYQSDVNDDSTECDCCLKCESECSDKR